ncbi:hypothetical protein GCM10007298_22150 [Williamsia phyllosphaerae]|uniref:CsbD-like domain-containing protein n=2 Tax=Nocardiaceae TaxID=85025 RepID=A0ABQ1UTJ9_9NOCA|nr:hypothetical protein GCM10007298_22150 [Williamsia phyllosphaerae]
MSRRAHPGGPPDYPYEHTTAHKEIHMSFVDKAKNAAEDAIGKAKEVVGDVTDNKDLEAEGKGDQGKAGVKKVGENIKDTFK